MGVQLVLKPCQFGLCHLLFFLPKLPSQYVMSDIIPYEDSSNYHRVVEDHPHNTKLIEPYSDRSIGHVFVIYAEDMVVPQSYEQ